MKHLRMFFLLPDAFRERDENALNQDFRGNDKRPAKKEISLLVPGAKCNLSLRNYGTNGSTYYR